MNQQARPLSIGRYQILDIVGSGAMGTVYKAHDPAIGRDVAIKVVRVDADSPQERAASIDRFRLEVQAAGRCSHPAIVGVYDFLDQSGDPAIVMELVEGTSLHRTLRDPAIQIASLLPALLLQVLEGLGYAHGQGIIHRDIKPANILVTSVGQAKIADFGIARVAGDNATVGGAMLGTPSYMAPEQLTDDKVDRRADLFAVGAILYEMLAGKSPFAGRTVPETIIRLSAPGSADMAPVAAAGGQRFIPLLQRALDRDRTRRFQTADEFAAALQVASSASKGAIEDDPGATVVMSRGATVMSRGATVMSRGATAMSSRAATGTPSPPASFDPSLLQRVELQLARFVGPMARMMVTRATQQASGPNDLYASLARELPNAADRSLFLRLVGGGRVEPSLGGRDRPGQAMPPQTVPPQTVPPQTVPPPSTMAPRTAAGAIPPAAIAAAQAALVVHVGPIARVLARDAAAQAKSSREFIDLLCAHVTKPEERVALQRRLRAEVEPKLV